MEIIYLICIRCFIIKPGIYLIIPIRIKLLISVLLKQFNDSLLILCYKLKRVIENFNHYFQIVMFWVMKLIVYNINMDYTRLYIGLHLIENIVHNRTFKQ